jgi:hypothetical protein
LLIRRAGAVADAAADAQGLQSPLPPPQPPQQPKFPVEKLLLSPNTENAPTTPRLTTTPGQDPTAVVGGDQAEYRA